jgi:geranylgeranyl reductase family protein
MRHFDVAVIGSGPAGASTAFKLAENGISTVIIEKENLPRYKTCGGGFVFRGRKLLPFDVSSAIDKEFHKVDVYFSGQNIHLTATRDQPIISMVMRDKFDKLIVDEAKKLGVTLLENHKLIGLKFQDNVILETSQESISAKFVIAADGALSPTAKLAGWEKETRKLIPALEYEVELTPEEHERLSKEVRFDVDFVPYGYAWSFPKKNHISIGVASARRDKINLKKVYLDYLKELGIKEIVSEDAHGFQIPVSARKDGFVKNNVFLIGDAAGFADPLTAEGISNAIYSGFLVANAIIESKLDRSLAEKLYLEKLNEKLVPELKTGDFLSKFFYEKVKIRNYFINRSGDRFCNYLTDIFMGDRYYPKDIIKTVKNKIKEALFKGSV